MLANSVTQNRPLIPQDQAPGGKCGEGKNKRKENSSEQPHRALLKAFPYFLLQLLLPACAGCDGQPPHAPVPAAPACPEGLRAWKLLSFQLWFSVKTLGGISVLLKIEFHLLPVVQELGPALRGLWHWQQPLEQVELSG